jgi:hypothetical protein
MRLKQPCLAAGRAEQVVAKRVAEQGVAADGLHAWEVAVAALLASPKAAWNMRGIDSGTSPQLNAIRYADSSIPVWNRRSRRRGEPDRIGRFTAERRFG